MGKRRHSHSYDEDSLELESVEDGEDSSESPRKKHKKSKHKKHKKTSSSSSHHNEHHGDHSERREHKKKKKKHREQESESGGSGLKLKIKLGGHTVSTANVNKAVISQYTEDDDDEEHDDETASDDGDLFELEDTLVQEEVVEPAVVKREDRDEEQKWLDALEAGELDDSGQLKSERRKPLTARQRSLRQEQTAFQEELMELPMRRKEKEVTEEMLARRSEMARKRRLKQQTEQEEIKKQTVKKLITKQSKRKDDEKEVVAKRSLGPRVQYTCNSEHIGLSYPDGFDFPLAKQPPREPPKAEQCSAANCSNVRKYACSSNGLPVCSLACYKVVKDLPPPPTTSSIRSSSAAKLPRPVSARSS